MSSSYSLIDHRWDDVENNVGNEVIGSRNIKPGDMIINGLIIGQSQQKANNMVKDWTDNGLHDMAWVNYRIIIKKINKNGASCDFK